MAQWLDGRVVETRHWTPTLFSLRVAGPPLAFRAGQFVRIALDVAGERIARPFSFVNPPEDLVLRAIGECDLTLLQFHGDETPEFCAQFGVMSMKAFRIRDTASLQGLAAYNTDAWLLDAYSSDKLGGTGATFNWDLAIEAKKSGKPIFLAGGLTPENVAEAVRRVQPFGVDVSSGVESAPGKKDSAKVRAFIAAAKAAARV